MKTTTIIVRILLGVIYTAFSLAYFLDLMPRQEMEGPIEQLFTGLIVSGYIMPLVKGLELICGISLITGKFAPLAAVVIFPVTLNIFLIHAFLASEGMFIQVFMLLANLFLAYAYRERYRPILQV